LHEKFKAGDDSKIFESPPANTDLGYQACISGAAWVASALLRHFWLQTPPKGPSLPSIFRNYAGPQHFCHYRGYDSAWVPGTVLGARVGRTNLLFRIDLGLAELPSLHLYY
jgi:hypothetical protein